MAKFYNLTGKKYGRLSVTGQHGNDNFGNVTWMCQCDCGEQAIVTTNSLNSGHTKSCGCFHLESASRQGTSKRLPKGESAFNSLLNTYKWNASSRSLVWDIDKESFRTLIKRPCYYCGAEPSNIMKAGGGPEHYGELTYNGLDRTDNDKGYTLDNVKPCCKQCNLSKRRLSEKQFIDWIRRAYKHLEGSEIYEQ